jgi:hypothetical protein
MEALRVDLQVPMEERNEHHYQAEHEDSWCVQVFSSSSNTPEGQDRSNLVAKS